MTTIIFQHGGTVVSLLDEDVSSIKKRQVFTGIWTSSFMTINLSHQRFGRMETLKLSAVISALTGTVYTTHCQNFMIQEYRFSRFLAAESMSNLG